MSGEDVRGELGDVLAWHEDCSLVLLPGYAVGCDGGTIPGAEYDSIAEARQFHLAAMLAKYVATKQAEAWNHALQAVAWTGDNGGFDLSYVAGSNPYRGGDQ